MMNKKKIILSLSLLALTVLVIFTPMAINALGNSNRLGTKTYWNYDEREKVKLTNLQVAEIVCDFAYYGGTALPVTEEFNKEDSNQSIEKALFAVFGNNEKLYEYFKDYLQNDPEIYEKGSLLTVTDNRPVTLVTVNASFRKGEGYFIISYEEKTNTVISFYYYNDGSIPEWRPDSAYMPSYWDITNAASAYYLGIGLPKDRYYTEQVDDSNITIFGLRDDFEKDPIEYET